MWILEGTWCSARLARCSGECWRGCSGVAVYCGARGVRKACADLTPSAASFAGLTYRSIIRPATALSGFPCIRGKLHTRFSQPSAAPRAPRFTSSLAGKGNGLARRPPPAARGEVGSPPLAETHIALFANADTGAIPHTPEFWRKMTSWNFFVAWTFFYANILSGIA